jgi:beta-glucosidase
MTSTQYRCIALLLLLAPFFSYASGQAVPSEHANEARIDHLLQQMTLEEKVNLIRGDVEDPSTYQGQAGYLPGVPRLHVPSLRFADGPPGLLTRVPAQAETATMGVAATFSVKDAEANGEVIGREARSLGIDVALQPFINIDRDITFARAYNTFGEDPFLTGLMGAAEIRGIQSQDVMAQAKHYVAYDTDGFNVYVDQQALHEVYVAPFVMAVQAGVSSVMCSYNKVNRRFACGNPDTLKTILKGDLGFKGFVTSDWGAVHSVDFLNQGMDMEMPGLIPDSSPFAGMMHTFFRTAPPLTKPAGKPDLSALAGMLGGTIPEEPAVKMDMSSFPRETDNSTLRDALKNGSITEATVTAAARRVLYEMDRFGYLDGKQKHTITPQDIEANAAVIRKTAADAAVLLKNEGNILPLDPRELSSVALIGPTAGQVDAIGTFGERSPGIPSRQIGPLEALRKDYPDVHITFAVADNMTGTPIPAAAFTHDGKPGLQRSSEADSASLRSVDAQLDFTSENGHALEPNAAVTWKGQLTVPVAGNYWIYLQVLGARGKISVDGKPLGYTGATKGAVHGDIQHATQDNVLPTPDGLDNVRRSVYLTAGAHPLSVDLSGDTSNNPEQVRLSWYTPEQRTSDHSAALEAAKSAKTAVVFAWTRGKPAFTLPGDQDKLIEEIADLNPNTIVVLNTSEPIAMPWLSKVKAVVEMWWPGDEGGWATADILTGKVDPAGRLPVTWARRLQDYAATDPTHPERSAAGVDGKTTFSEGIDVGYRWFDKQNIEPLYSFGYGLSYASFAYSELHVTPAADGGADVEFHVKNTGQRNGDDVPQVYLDAPSAQGGAQFAVRTLAGFDRITLAAGAETTVRIHVPKRSFEFWSVAQNQWVHTTGQRTLEVGLSSRNLTLHAILH